MTAHSSIPVPFKDLPEGTVTFLFTDIEGSTKLLDRLRERYETLLADHRQILRNAFAKWNGHEVDTQGDAFFVAFSRASLAVRAATEAQHKLAEHVWPEQVAVRVRMGIHTGEPWSGEEGYVGMDVHRAARIAHVGHGGQVLLSETATALVRDDLQPGVSLLDLGRHLLKDIRHPEHICQLVMEGLPAEFPPLTSLEALPSGGTRLGVLVILQSDDPAMLNQHIEIVNPVSHLGRKSDNTIIFSKDSPVSRHHAVIEAHDGQLFLGEIVAADRYTDHPIRPAFGTFVNGLQVQEPVMLRDGDEILLGKRLRIRFEAVPGRPAGEERTLDQLAPSADDEAIANSVGDKPMISSVVETMPTFSGKKKKAFSAGDKGMNFGPDDETMPAFSGKK